MEAVLRYPLICLHLVLTNFFPFYNCELMFHYFYIALKHGAKSRVFVEN